MSCDRTGQLPSSAKPQAHRPWGHPTAAAINEVSLIQMLIWGMCAPAMILAPLQAPSCPPLAPRPSGLFQSPRHFQPDSLTGPLGDAGMRKGRREWRGRSPGAGLLPQASVGLGGPDRGVGLWASANLPQEGVGEFPESLAVYQTQKRLGKAAREPYLVGCTHFSLTGFSYGFPHIGS